MKLQLMRGCLCHIIITMFSLRANYSLCAPLMDLSQNINVRFRSGRNSASSLPSTGNPCVLRLSLVDNCIICCFAQGHMSVRFQLLLRSYQGLELKAAFRFCWSACFHRHQQVLQFSASTPESASVGLGHVRCSALGGTVSFSGHE